MTCTKRCCAGLFLLLMLPAVVIAGPLPQLLPPNSAPGLLPPPILPKFPPEPVLPPSHPTLPVSAYISGIRYYLDQLKPGATTSRDATDAETTPRMQTRDSAVIGSLNLTTDSIPDVEPSITAINKNG